MSSGTGLVELVAGPPRACSSVTVFVVHDFEMGRREPPAEVRRVLQSALEKSGIAFVTGSKSLGIIVERESSASRTELNTEGRAPFGN